MVFKGKWLEGGFPQEKLSWGKSARISVRIWNLISKGKYVDSKLVYVNGKCLKGKFVQGKLRWVSSFE